MNVKEIAHMLGMTEAQVLAQRTTALGRVDKMWRCGTNGTITNDVYDCSCDSVLCDLGEWVIVIPESKYQETVIVRDS